MPKPKKSNKVVGGLLPGSKVWVACDDENELYETASFLFNKKGWNNVRLSKNDQLVQLSPDTPIWKYDEERINKPDALNDLVQLTPPVIPSILHVLKARSMKYNLPYTYVGPVLISVNPLCELPELDSKKNTHLPHPHRIAEAAMKQMRFAKLTQQPMNQSIIVSGESGAGKTEASKRVLKRLVTGKGAVSKRKDESKSKSLDKRLIDTNPILEAFGNATTLRNRNSSRFGKFMKLNVEKGSGGINGAIVETYLLERSRVCGFVQGECNYHIFYQLLAGASSSMKSEFKIGKPKFEYLKPFDKSTTNTNRPDSRDSKEFKQLAKSFNDIGVKEKTQNEIFAIVAGILHMGNIYIDEDAKVGSSNDALKHCAKLLGVKPQGLEKVMCQKQVNVGGELIYSPLTQENAIRARDAIAKHLYSQLFAFIVQAINKDIKPLKTTKEDAFVGVLDIFGFEAFDHNDLEQLLINYTNEALHAIFLQKVFDAELSLYISEGLVPDSKDNGIQVPENEACMQLLRGTVSPRKLGILDVIVDQGKNPGASDKKMNSELHKQFGTSVVHFPRPHPKDIGHTFNIQHFPGIVQYTVGNFLSKNHDRLPNMVEEFFRDTTCQKTMKTLWKTSETSKPASDSIVHKFKSQIQALSNTLESSQCSFIRCIKPNYYLNRDGEWFEKPYVNNQLKCLGIEPTVKVLSKGMPNRIPYAELTETYKTQLPKDAIKLWKKLKGGNREFISALFWAYGISSDTYRLGLSYVFFRSGDLETLEKVMEGKTSTSESKTIGKRFKMYFVRAKVRKIFACYLAKQCFINQLEQMRKAEEKKLVKQQKKSAVVLQRLWRGIQARKLKEMLLEKKIKEKEKEQKNYEKKLAKQKKERKENQAKKKRADRKAREKLKKSRGKKVLKQVDECLEEHGKYESEKAKISLQEKEIEDLKKERHRKKKEIRSIGKKKHKKSSKHKNRRSKSKHSSSPEDTDDGPSDADDGILDKYQEKLSNDLDDIQNTIDEKERKLKKRKSENRKTLSRANTMMMNLDLKNDETLKEVVDEGLKNNKNIAELDKVSAELEEVSEKIAEGVQKLQDVASSFQFKQRNKKSRVERKLYNSQMNKWRSKDQIHQTKLESLAFLNNKLTKHDRYTFFACKRARKSARNWKRRFFVFLKKENVMHYYKRDDGIMGKGIGLKGTFTISPMTMMEELGDLNEKRKHIIKLTDQTSGDLLLSFDVLLDMYSFVEALNKWQKEEKLVDNRKSKRMSFVVGRNYSKPKRPEPIAAELESEEMIYRLEYLVKTGEISQEDCDAIYRGMVKCEDRPDSSDTLQYGTIDCSYCEVSNVLESGREKCRECNMPLFDFERKSTDGS